MVTIKDIAARLQVSPSTVGRALADDPRISASTKQKVTQVADELGYVGNLAARMMRGVSSNLVGFVLPDIRNSFYATIAHALSKCLQEAGYQLALSETGDDKMAELRSVRELASSNVAGIIIVPTARPHRDTIRLLRMRPHVQLLRGDNAIGEEWFGIDDTQALYDATDYLVQQGHRRIGYIGVTDVLPTGSARLKGFLRALPLETKDRDELVELGSPAQVGFGREAVRRLLSRKVRPTAIVAASVQMTQGILEELLEQRIRVPEELSVIGFGDDVGFGWWGPGLTTIGLPVSELATACGLWFVHKLRHSAEQGSYRSVSQASLIVRGSTAPVAVSTHGQGKAVRRGVTV